MKIHSHLIWVVHENISQYPFLLLLLLHHFHPRYILLLRSSAWQKKIRAKKNWGLEEREFIKFIHECVTMKSCFYHFAFFGEWERKSEREGFFCEGQMRKNVLPQISASDFYRVPALKSLRLFRSQNKTEGNQHEDIWDLRFFDIKFKHKFAKWHLFWMCSKKLCKDFFFVLLL